MTNPRLIMGLLSVKHSTMQVLTSYATLLLLISMLLLKYTGCALNKILGGTECLEGEFPYQLSLRYNGHLVCGAALVSRDTALTAAHCLQKHGLYSVRAGSVYLDQGGMETYVKKAILHPSFDIDTLDYDLAILKFTEPLKLSNEIRPVKLPGEHETLPTKVTGYVTGWGSVSTYFDSIPELLRAVELPVLDRTTCKDDYRNINRITSRMFCAGYREGGKDSCQGDSGGPFVVNGTLYGLVSWGFNCGEPGYPGVYTNISALRRYIELNAHL